MTSFRSFAAQEIFCSQENAVLMTNSAQDALNDEAAARDEDLTSDKSNEAVDTFFDLRCEAVRAASRQN